MLVWEQIFRLKKLKFFSNYKYKKSNKNNSKFRKSRYQNAFQFCILIRIKIVVPFTAFEWGRSNHIGRGWRTNISTPGTFTNPNPFNSRGRPSIEANL
jgi:hypothetical protein